MIYLRVLRAASFEPVASRAFGFPSFAKACKAISFVFPNERGRKKARKCRAICDEEPGRHGPPETCPSKPPHKARKSAFRQGVFGVPGSLELSGLGVDLGELFGRDALAHVGHPLRVSALTDPVNAVRRRADDGREQDEPEHQSLACSSRNSARRDGCL